MPHLIPDSSADARLCGLERFVEFWVGPRRPEYGVATEILAATELPDPLRRLYAFGGCWPPFRAPYTANRFSVQDHLLVPGGGKFASAHRLGEYLVFVDENQNVWVAATLARGVDPKVFISENTSHRAANPKWIVLDHSLSHFLVTFMLQELIFGAQKCACADGALSEFRKAACKIEPVWVDAEFVWPEVKLSHYLINDRILIRNAVGNIEFGGDWYGYNDPSCVTLLNSLGLPSSLQRTEMRSHG